ncbi:unnamed protein product [Adineta ricciae]|uniref:Uncharacterized protein n=1 Tax=Adineta ricciae TaxID=249248 RepID=A0A816F2R7_ADIRI|nr:unnamed protein product [Adineta ricciae]
MTQNRRFPFQHTQMPISLDNFTTNEQQLYPIVRQYTLVCRHVHKQPRYEQIQDVPDQDRTRFNEFIHNLKQERDNYMADENNFSALREHDLQHWKDVNYQWQTYYREEMRKQQEIFTDLLKSSPR